MKLFISLSILIFLFGCTHSVKKTVRVELKKDNSFNDTSSYNVDFLTMNGKFITSAGGAKSFEASLYLCEYLYGKTIADELAKGMVIDWNLEHVPHEVTSLP